MKMRSLLIKVLGAATTTISLENVSGAETIAAILEAILVKLNWPVDQTRWRLQFHGRDLSLNATLNDLFGDGVLELTLIEVRTGESLSRGPGGAADAPAMRPQTLPLPKREAPACPPPAAAPACPPAAEAPAPMPSPATGTRSRSVGRAELSKRDAERDEDEDRGEEVLEGAWQSRDAKTATRRATVRYYSRMNPERLYPMLVILSKDMIEQIRKKDVDQRGSEAFDVKKEIPIEVEPVLPGCDCYPPRITAYLSPNDQTFTFRVAPRVLGKIEGAKVIVRQQHTSLAEIDLEMKVSRRLWVVISGLLTFFLPGLSTILKHFGLDFTGSGGVNFYLALAEALFSWISPIALAGVLGSVTVALWWMTRPKARDVFWDIRTLPADQKHEQPAAPRGEGGDGQLQSPLAEVTPARRNAAASQTPTA